MKLLPTIVAVGFVSISVFGLVLMPHDGSNHNFVCLVTIVSGAISPCPEDDPLGFASFHNFAIQKIDSSTLINGMVVSPVSVLLYVAMLGGVLFLLADRFTVNQMKFSKATILNARYSILDTKLRWFSLHEKRDPVSVF